MNNFRLNLYILGLLTGLGGMATALAVLYTACEHGTLNSICSTLGNISAPATIISFLILLPISAILKPYPFIGIGIFAIICALIYAFIAHLLLRQLTSLESFSQAMKKGLVIRLIALALIIFYATVGIMSMGFYG